MMGSLWTTCFLACWLSVAGYQPVMIPPELQSLMAGVNDIASFMKAMNLGNVTVRGAAPIISVPGIVRKRMPIQRNGISGLLGKPGPAARRKPGIPGSKPLLEFGRTKAVSIDDLPGPLTMLENVNCGANPQVIPVPQPQHSHGFYYPTHVRLHRCAGACSNKPRVLECAPTATKNITLLVFSVAWNPSKNKGVKVRRQLYNSAATYVQVTNHTRCGCRCVTKPSECDPKSQIFKKEHCRCECKERTGACPLGLQWDQMKCKCTCNPYHIPKCPERQEWNKDTCRCGCKRTCKMRFKVRNPRNCRCECPRSPPCKKGETKDRHCKCVKSSGQWRNH